MLLVREVKRDGQHRSIDQNTLPRQLSTERTYRERLGYRFLGVERWVRAHASGRSTSCRVLCFEDAYGVALNVYFWVAWWRGV